MVCFCSCRRRKKGTTPWTWASRSETASSQLLCSSSWRCPCFDPWLQLHPLVDKA
uniref:Uncharacterized protein n=1 Tax=Arundo donax TaxID=35708 RepID=A0A0A8Y2M0_ARUDO